MTPPQQCPYNSRDPASGCSNSYAAGYSDRSMLAIRITYAAVFCILALLCWVRIRPVFRGKGFFRWSVQHKLMYICLYVTLTFSFRAPYPLAWGLPNASVHVYNFFVDLAAAACVAAGLIVVFDWFVVISRITGHANKISSMERLGNRLCVCLLILLPAAGVCQGLMEKAYIPRAFKMFLGGVFCSIVLFLSLIFGAKIATFLMLQHEHETKSEQRVSITVNSNNNTEHEDRHLSQRTKRINRISRIKGLLRTTNVLLVTLICFDIVFIAYIIVNKRTLSEPGPPPEGVSGVLFQGAVFDVFTFFAVCLIIHFFSAVNKSSQAQCEHTRSRTASTQKRSMSPVSSQELCSATQL